MIFLKRTFGQCDTIAQDYATHRRMLVSVPAPGPNTLRCTFLQTPRSAPDLQSPASSAAVPSPRPPGSVPLGLSHDNELRKYITRFTLMDNKWNKGANSDT